MSATDAHVVGLNAGTVYMHNAFVCHLNHLPRCGFGGHAVGADHDVAHGAVGRVALFVEGHPARVGVAVEHRPAAGAACSGHGLMRVRLQVNHLAAGARVCGQSLLHGRRHRGAAAQCVDAVEAFECLEDHLTLHVAERGLALLCEILWDRHADAPFDLDVGVTERQAHHLRHFLAEPGLARTHHADDDG